MPSKLQPAGDLCIEIEFSAVTMPSRGVRHFRKADTSRWSVQTQIQRSLSVHISL
jgi:hypothetical protein